MLSSERRQQLDKIVVDLAGKNAPQQDVQMIVDDFKNKYGNEDTKVPNPDAVPVKDKGILEGQFSSEGKTVGQNIFLGVGKGALNTLDSLSQMGQDILKPIVNKATNTLLGTTAVPEQPTAKLPDYLTTPEGAAQKVGSFAEQTAEWFIPAKATAQLIKVANSGVMMSKLASLGAEGAMAAKAVSFATRSGILAGEAAGITKVQTYGEKNSNEQVKMNAIIAGALPTVGLIHQTAIKPLFTSVGRKIQNSVIKPSAKDIKDGFNIENVGKYEVGGTLQQMSERTQAKLTSLNEQLNKVITKADGTINLNSLIDDVSSDFSTSGTKTFGFNTKLGKAMQTFREEVAMISPDGNVSIAEAQQIKRAVGKLGAWQYGMRDPESSALETVANNLYAKLKIKIEQVSPEVIRDINKQMSDLIPIENAIIRRIPVAERASIISLSDILTAAPMLIHPGNWWIALLNRMSKSGTVGNVLEKAGKATIKEQGPLKTILFGPKAGAAMTPQETNAAGKVKTVIDSIAGKGGLSVQDVGLGKPGYAKKKVGSHQSPLLSEAKKYSTPEEFVKSIRFRGEPTDYGKPFGTYITQTKTGLPRVLSGSGGVPTSRDFITARGFGNEVRAYLPKTDAKILSNPNEILKIAKVSSPHNFFFKPNKVPPVDGTAFYERAKTAGYDAVDLAEVEKLYRAKPEGIIFLKGNEVETRIINRDAFTEVKNPPKTAKELTDIWKQAHSEKVKTLVSTPPYKPNSQLTTKLLKKLEGKTTISKQFISDLTNAPDLKQTEKDVIRQVLQSEGDKVNVAEFGKKVEMELLPLKVLKERTIGGNKKPRYEGISLPNELRGEVKDYTEHIYESPIKTSAGSTHFSGDTNNYFGHTRVEDMAPEWKVGNTTYESKSAAKVFGDNPIEQPKVRRIIEVQSDLYQKGNLERQASVPYKIKAGIEVNYNDINKRIKAIQENKSLTQVQRQSEVSKLKRIQEDLVAKANAPEELARVNELKKLEQYNNPTAHFRMVREEIKKAADDGIEKLQFPTGETGMKIEGLGERPGVWRINSEPNSKYGGFSIPDINSAQKLTPENLKIGQTVHQGTEGQLQHDAWIITDILGDGKFKAVQKNTLEMEGDYKNFTKGQWEAMNKSSAAEEFDISGKVDTNNPIYKFYEKELGRYLKNNFDAKNIVDKQGVQWMEVNIKPEYKGPVTAFGKAKIGTIISGAATLGTLSTGVAVSKTGRTETYENKPLQVNKTIISRNNESLGSFKSDDRAKELTNWTKGESSFYNPLDENQTRKGTDGTGAYGRKVEKGSVAFGNRYFQDALKKGAKIYIQVKGMEDVITPYGKGIFRIDDTMNQRYSIKGKFNIDFHPEDLNTAQKKKGRFPIEWKIVKIDG